MSQARRPAGTPVGGQFAPMNRPEATGINLVDDDSPENVDIAAPATGRAAHPRHALTSDPALARLDEAGRRLAEHLGYDYAALDAVDEHHGLTTSPSTLGLVTYDEGKHFFVVGTSATGHGVLPFGPQVFTPAELEAEIAKTIPAGLDREGQPEGQPGASGRGEIDAAPRERPPQRYSHASAIREGQRSPWGTIDYVSHWDVGITNVGTAGHGGVKLSPGRNRVVHPAWRRPGGWYEEDCEWAIVAVTFPECYSPEHAATARTTARDWFPDEYEVVTGEQIRPGESHVRDQRTFFAEHANDWVTTAALAADPGTVERIVRDDGVTGGLRLVQAEQKMVKVWARVGGRHATGPETRAFLVPASDYATRGRFGFIVDPDHYEEVAP